MKPEYKNTWHGTGYIFVASVGDETFKFQGAGKTETEAFEALERRLRKAIAAGEFATQLLFKLRR